MIQSLGTIMRSSATVTVLTGVTVFVVGQLIAKRFVEPYVSFREQLGRITVLLLREQAKITNSNVDAEIIHDLKDAAAQLMAKYSALPNSLKRSYIGMRFIPSESKILESAQTLNLVASRLEGKSGENTYNLIKQIDSISIYQLPILLNPRASLDVLIILSIKATLMCGVKGKIKTKVDSISLPANLNNNFVILISLR